MERNLLAFSVIKTGSAGIPRNARRRRSTGGTGYPDEVCSGTMTRRNALRSAAMAIEKNSVVTLHYKMKNAAGEVLDSTESRGPLLYLHGLDPLLPGLQKALEGKNKGDNV